MPDNKPTTTPPSCSPHVQPSYSPHAHRTAIDLIACVCVPNGVCYFHAHHFFGFLHHAPASTLFNNLFLIHISYSHASTLLSHEFIFFLAVQSKLFKSTLSTGGVQNRTIATTMPSGHFSARSLYYHKGVATGLSCCCRHLAQEGELCPLGSTTSPRDLLPAFPVRWILFPFYLTHS